MQVLAFGALAVAVGAQLAVNSKYAAASRGVCNEAEGYVMKGYAVGGTYTAPTTFPTADGSACVVADGTSIVVECATNYAPSSGSGFAASNTGGIIGASSVSELPSVIAENYDFPDDTTFTCTLIQCYYACVARNAFQEGTACIATAGVVSVGTTADSLCFPGFIAEPITTATCPSSGASESEPWVFYCTNDPNVYTGPFEDVATLGAAYSLPGSCRCTQGDLVDCPRLNTASPACANCNVECPAREGDVRQSLRAPAAICPNGTTTLAAMEDCFEQAACAGAIDPDVDSCHWGSGQACATSTCPQCPSSSSKKGLLGLLGLLALIPLLCSCLLLLIICRSKTGNDVHFATFDAGGSRVVGSFCAPPLTCSAPGPVGPAVEALPVPVATFASPHTLA
eukprot:TRINITY_DN36365_c0_g1_i1.p1 TRINITY_DN36365_c0_g1~~TRINITY_DN36365_c0_g1_i1.p1  ORF type:complete len:397 (+),score=56.73 TRINITY_DN36365_c0_g1_i1:223-1413(+)